MSSFIWPCAVLPGSLWTGIESRIKPLQSPGSVCSGSMDDKSFSGMAAAHARAHIYKHVHAKLLCDTRLEARVTHANETGPASSQQHNVILHSSASLQKPKSFSPPSPVIVALMERRSGNHLFSHTVRKTHKPFSICVCFLLLREKKKKSFMYTNSNIVSGTWHMQWTKAHLQGHRVAFKQEEMSDQSGDSQGYNRDISSVSFRSMSSL